MGMISRLYTFVNGTKALAQQVNAELDQLVTAHNTNDTALSAVIAESAVTTAALPTIPRSSDIKGLRVNGDNVIEVTFDNVTWQASGSSGHLIIDKDGGFLPQRSRLKFANTTVTDDGTMTVVNGIKGDTGDTGPAGPQGVQGIQGIQGATGYSIIPEVNQVTGLMTFSEGPAGSIPSPVYVKGPQGVPGPQGIQGPAGVSGPQGPAGPQGIQGPTGPQGLAGQRGADGTSFAILGLYPTLLALQTAHPNGNAGDAYAVGTQISNVIYNWDVAQTAWVNLGSLQGPQGPQGIQGVQGSQGPEGPQGAPGVDGTDGVDGLTVSVNNVTHVGGNISLTLDNLPDGSSKVGYTQAEKTKLGTVATNANNYSHPTTAGNKHIPTGGASNQFLKYSASGTAVWSDLPVSTVTYTGTLDKDDWTGSSAPYSQTITVTGMASTDEPIADVTFSGVYLDDISIASAWSKVYDLETSTNQVTFYADEIPSVNVTVRMKVVR